MFKLNTIFSGPMKSDNNQNQNSAVQSNLIKTTRNWYEEKSDKLIVQRNILLVFSLLLIVLIILAISTVIYIVNSREFSPFVIQIDDSSGMATVVNPLSSTVLDDNEALAKYFLKRYLIARETYNPVDFDTEARKTVRLLSTSSVYYAYLGYIKNKDYDPVIKYAQNNTTFLTIKSWSKLDSTKYIIRFSITETVGNKSVFNKIAVVSFAYVAMELTDADRDINPIGFQVNGYRVDDDNS
ncbi:MAG: virB8 family protein [Rickettsia endosymbiont of Bryobia graminum]|nr:virB8 family protein [Rickettsia endosymbiont of Bryobia graminum]